MIFTINGIVWQVVFVNANSCEIMRSDNTFTLGVTDNNDKTVYLSNALKGALLDKVLCHELVHCACFSYNIYYDIQTEEFIADFLATYGRNIFEIADDILYRISRIA